MAKRSKKLTNPGDKIWPADKIERWNIVDLLPSAQNAKEHTPDQVEAIAKSIDEYGWTMPVLVDEEGELIAGHGRVLAARLRQIEFIPTMVAVGWTEAQKRAYRIADNRLTEIGRWDRKKLSAELKALAEMSSAAPTGFSGNQIKALLAADLKSGSPDTAPRLSGLVYGVAVACDDEEGQIATIEKLEALGFKCRATIS